MGKRVVVAMSGGVDSSVAAYLIKEAGYDPIGITMQVYDHSEDSTNQFGSCCGLSDIDDARRVANSLDIPYYVIDFEKDFNKAVVENFVDEYVKGRTPIPCVHCNNEVKFLHLYEKAKELGADFVATGHYASILKDDHGTYHLQKAEDLNKDQTYFLFGLTQEQLAHTLFPLGKIKKPEVRKIAKDLGLRTHNKPDSTGICFVPDGDYASFVEKNRPDLNDASGVIISTNGTVLGKHKGVHKFTVGQRHGLGIAIGEPLYVIAIDAEKQQVIVGKANECFFKGLKASKLNWILDPKKQETLSCKVRYRATDVPCEIVELQNDMVQLSFPEPVRAVAPGQAVVFYSNDETVGGGWIDEATISSHPHQNQELI